MIGTLRKIIYSHKTTPTATGNHIWARKLSEKEYILHSVSIHPVSLSYPVEAYVTINFEGDPDTSAIHAESGYASLREPFWLSRPVRFTGPASITLGANAPETTQMYLCFGLEVVA